MMNIELKVNELEFKGTINKPSEEAQALFSSILACLFEQPKAVEENKPKVVLQDKVNTPFTYFNPIKHAEAPELRDRDKPVEQIKRKLLIGTCECGERHFIWIYDNGRAHTFKCRKCDKEHTAEYSKLIRANISCKNCGNKAFAYVGSTKTIDTNCKQCNSPVDLSYHEAHKCMESL